MLVDLKEKEPSPFRVLRVAVEKSEGLRLEDSLRVAKALESSERLSSVRPRTFWKTFAAPIGSGPSIRSNTVASSISKRRILRELRANRGSRSKEHKNERAVKME